MPTVRAHLITLVDEAELEAARVASMHTSSLLPPALDPHLSNSNAPARREPSAPPDAREEPVEVEDEELLDAFDETHEARTLLDAGDEAAALALVERVLRRSPSNAPARRIAEECEQALTAKYAAELGSLARVPRLSISVDQLVSLSLDHRAGFLLSFVDGASTLATIVDMSGMPASEVLRSLLQLHERRIIVLR